MSYCSVTDVGLVSVTRISRLRNMTILHLSGLTPTGLAAALLTCGGLTKVKLHTSFRPLLPEHIFKHMEARGCVFHWRDKAFQVRRFFPCYRVLSHIDKTKLRKIDRCYTCFANEAKANGWNVFQVEIDPKGRQLQLERRNEAL